MYSPAEMVGGSRSVAGPGPLSLSANASNREGSVSYPIGTSGLPSLLKRATTTPDELRNSKEPPLASDIDPEKVTSNVPPGLTLSSPTNCISFKGETSPLDPETSVVGSIGSLSEVDDLHPDSSATAINTEALRRDPMSANAPSRSIDFTHRNERSATRGFRTSGSVSIVRIACTVPHQRDKRTSAISAFCPVS